MDSWSVRSTLSKRSEFEPWQGTSCCGQDTLLLKCFSPLRCINVYRRNVQGWKLSRSNKVVVKSFSGATTSDMEDYLKPIIRKCPESLILHVGTNDLLSIQTPHQIAESIVNLADQIQSDSPGTFVTISAICVRKEDELWKKATEINKLLKRFNFVPIEDGPSSYQH